MEVIARYTFKGLPSAAMDLRWASKDTVYIVRVDDGVATHRLEPGLPEDRLIIPGRNRESHVPMLIQMAVSSDGVIAASGARLVEASSRDSVDGIDAHVSGAGPASIGAIDILGSDVVLYGTPTQELWKNHPDAILWKGKLKESQDAFSPLLEETRQGAAQDRTRFLAANGRLGALRFLTNGDLIFSPGYVPVVERVSAAGKVTATWDLSNLGVKALNPPLHEGELVDPQGLEDLAVHSQVVDSLVPLGKSPGVVVKTLREGEREWDLVLPGGDEPEVFRIPVELGRDVTRVVGDWRKGGDLVFLTSFRRPPREGDAGPQEILLCRLP
ncbi:MAG: hypothetical protein U0X73_04965 [Thermoanaerobaculia bacterium]